LLKKTVPHSCTAALLMAFSEFRNLEAEFFNIFKNSVFSHKRMIPFILHNTLLFYVPFPGSIATTSIIDNTDKHIDFLCN